MNVAGARDSIEIVGAAQLGFTATVSIAVPPGPGPNEALARAG